MPYNYALLAVILIFFKSKKILKKIESKIETTNQKKFQIEEILNKTIENSLTFRLDSSQRSKIFLKQAKQVI